MICLLMILFRHLSMKLATPMIILPTNPLLTTMTLSLMTLLKPQAPTTMIVNAAESSGHTKLLPSNFRRAMSKSSTRFANQVEYCVSKHHSANSSLSLVVGRGANGGVAGSDVRLIFQTTRTLDIRGIDNHQITNIAVGTVGGVITTQKGPVITIMH